MPKFKVGDKIEFEMDGKKVSGTITRDYNSPDHAMYDVRVGTKTMTIADTPMHPANACKNANFKVGDKVRIKDWQGIWEVTKTPPGMLEVKSDDGFVGITQVEKATPVKGANACRNASFKVGDKVTYWMFDKKLDGSVKAVRGERVDIDDGHGGVVTFKARDLEVWNAKACNSRNPIVAKAMNACGTARNATPEASIRSEFNRLVREADRFKADKDALKKREMQLEKQFDQLQKDAERSKLDALAFEIFGKSTDYFA